MHSSKITFVNGEPTYTGDNIYRCFAGAHNGLLFRIVNDTDYRWAFYNDTTNYTFTVRVSFGGLSKVEPLGHTRMTRNFCTATYDMEVVVAPGATELFMEGEPNGFIINLEAQRLSKRTGQLTKPVAIQLAPLPPVKKGSTISSSTDDDDDDDGEVDGHRGKKNAMVAPTGAPF